MAEKRPGSIRSWDPGLVVVEGGGSFFMHEDFHSQPCTRVLAVKETIPCCCLALSVRSSLTQMLHFSARNESSTLTCT